MNNPFHIQGYGYLDLMFIPCPAPHFQDGAFFDSDVIRQQVPLILPTVASCGFQSRTGSAANSRQPLPGSLLHQVAAGGDCGSKLRVQPGAWLRYRQTAQRAGRHRRYHQQEFLPLKTRANTLLA